MQPLQLKDYEDKPGCGTWFSKPQFSFDDDKHEQPEQTNANPSSQPADVVAGGGNRKIHV